MSWTLRAYDVVTSIVAGSLGLFAPRRALAYRLRRDSLRSFKAASMAGAHHNWNPRSRSADAEIKRDNNLVLSRCRDVAQNNSYIKGIIRKICNNVVRNGIRPQAQFKTADGGLDKPRNKRFEKHWKRWARKKYASLDGHDSFRGIQNLVLKHLWVDGEILVHRVWDRVSPRVNPLRLEVLEADLLNQTLDGVLPNGNIIRRGVELDSGNRPVFYHVYSHHPGDNIFAMPTTRRIPAENILHIFDRDRASQTRGISWFAAIVVETYDLDEYQSYERIGAKLAAAFGIFIKTNVPELLAGQALGGGVPPGETSLPTDSQGNQLEYINPGQIVPLPSGTDISIASHKRPGENYAPYVSTSLKGISAGVGVSYEALSNDYTDASYSSARSAALEERLTYRGQQGFLDENLNEPVWAWFLEGLYLSGQESMPGYPENCDDYEESVSWQAPGWAWIDPAKDSKAAETKLKLGITTRRKLAAEAGDDIDEIFDELERENAELRDRKILEEANASEQQKLQ